MTTTERAKANRAQALARGATWLLDNSKRLTHRRAFSHGHHTLYVAYYALELVRAERTLHAAVVGGILTFTAIAALAGGEG